VNRPPANGLPPGTLLGAFEIVSLLGRGGMGAVYGAKNRVTGDARAVKVILPELAARPDFVARFVREIRLAMAVDHPNLVRVFEPGMDGDQIFLPMELLLGESLGMVLRRQRSMPIGEASALLQAIGSALAALHARGILHRDVKPSNIFLARDEGRVVPKLLDLGAGKEVEATEEATATGLAVGSPHYMAPEQAAGQRDLDARVDQYALGVLAYQLVTGARPYENDDTGHVLAKVLSGAPYKRPREVLGSIPAALEGVILRAMSRNRDDRFPSMEAFLSAFESGAVESLPSTRRDPVVDATRAAPLAPPAVAPWPAAPPPQATEPSGTMQARVVPQAPATQTNPIVVGVVSAIAVFIVVGTVVGLRSTRSTREAPVVQEVQASPPPVAVPVPTPTVPAVPSPLPPPVTAPSTLPAETAPPVPTPAPVAPSASAPPEARPASTHSGRSRPATPSTTAAEPCHPTPGSPCL